MNSIHNFRSKLDGRTLRAMGEVSRTVQFQRRHFLFWVAIILFAAAAVFLAQNSRHLFADEPKIDDSFDYSAGLTVELPIEVAADGRVFVRDKPVSIKAMQPLPAFDELKYKVVDRPGNFIDTLIVRVTFESGLPSSAVLRSFAIHGVDQATEKMIDAQTVEYTALGLGPDAVFTIVAQLPKGTIDWPLWRTVLATLANWPTEIWLVAAFSLPLLTLIVLLVMFWPVIRQIIRPIVTPPAYSPPSNLPPALVGVLVNGRVSAREIAATVLDLAERNYLTIFNQDDNHFSFAKRRAWQNLRPYELQLLSQIFQQQGYKTNNLDIEVSLGQSLFSSAIAKVYVLMYDAAVEAGYFKHNPAEIHRHYRLIGLALFFIGLTAFTITLFFDLQPSYILFFFAGMMTMALSIIVAADSVPLLTPAGEQARQQWLAFSHYLSQPEPISYTEGAQATYERYLPYAVVLRVEGPWVNRFSRHPFHLPSWYDAPTKIIPIEDFARGLYRIVGAIAELFSMSKEPNVH